MLELGLRPVPSAEWQAEWDELMKDPWLRHKTDRERRLREHLAYCQKYLPMLATGPREWFVDIGPGCGETLEIARGLHHWALGIDAESGVGGMGDSYLRACRFMHTRQELDIAYCGFPAWIDRVSKYPSGEESVTIINSRGSWEQAFAEHMDGEPHHLHHDCKRLSWRWDAALKERMRLVLTTFRNMLLPGGVIMIAANGSANVDEYEREMLSAAFDVGLNVDLREPPTILRLRKP